MSGTKTQTQSDQPSQIPLTPNVSPPGCKKRKRLTCLTWNAGGLGQADWDHFQQWIRFQSLDIITIQESHWGYTSEWVQERYFCVHSGLNTRQAGVLTMINKKLCSQHDISWSEVVPGRILHTRIFGQTKNIDIINIYQHVHSSTKLLERQHIWDELHQTVSSLPSRNTWLLIGDFNTSLQKHSNAVGLNDYA